VAEAAGGGAALVSTGAGRVEWHDEYIAPTVMTTNATSAPVHDAPRRRDGAELRDRRSLSLAMNSRPKISELN
jgi:hypothetical protein